MSRARFGARLSTGLLFGLLLTSCGADAPAPAPRAGKLSNVAFLERAAGACDFAMRSADLAHEKASHAPVRALAEQLRAEHTHAQEVLQAVAVEHDVIPASPSTPEQQRELRRLEKLSGVAFEAAYLEQQLDAHRDLVDLYAQAIEELDGDVEAAAVARMPVLHQHVQQIEAVLANRAEPADAETASGR